jgi:hypothetical protein
MAKVAGIEIRLGPEDEYMHPGPEPTFNESMYLNTYDPATKVGVFLRIGNRPNEGYAEVTTCIYLPDGRVAFMYGRPEIDANTGFDAGGARIEVVTPFEELRIGYEGKVVTLQRPLDMADPRAAFTSNPWEDCSIELTVRGASEPWGGEPEVRIEREGEEFAKGHYEQLTNSTGTLRVADLELPIEGRGLRDHSWGPRTWQAPWYYRWLTVNMGDGTGMMLSRIAREDHDGIRNGFAWDGTRLLDVRDIRLHTGWEGGDHHHRSIAADFVLERPDGSTEELRLDGDVINLIPLRNRRGEKVTRISEGLTRWRLSQPLDAGHEPAGEEDPALVGYGWSEYLDQIVDGVPVGKDE